MSRRGIRAGLGMGLAILIGLGPLSGVTQEPRNSRRTSPPAVSPLIDALEDLETRGLAAQALVQTGPLAVPALAQALKDPDWHLRVISAVILADLGRPAQAAVPALIDALEDPLSDVVLVAAHALGQIGSAARAALSSLTLLRSAPDGAMLVVVLLAWTGLVTTSVVRVGRSPQPYCSAQQPPGAWLEPVTRAENGATL
jgi:hypothetical protein